MNPNKWCFFTHKNTKFVPPIIILARLSGSKLI
jgi:hypothetical protein